MYPPINLNVMKSMSQENKWFIAFIDNDGVIRNFLGKGEYFNNKREAIDYLAKFINGEEI